MDATQANLAERLRSTSKELSGRSGRKLLAWQRTSQEELDRRFAELAELRRKSRYVRELAQKNGANPDCLDCNGLGMVRREVPVGHEDFGRLFPCDCTLDARLVHLESVSGLLPDERRLRFADITLDGFAETAELVGLTRDFVARGDGWFTVWGGPGNAKTMVLQAAVNEYRERYRQAAMYVIMADVLDWIRAGFDEKQPDLKAADRVARLQSIPFLAIDEFDKIKATEWADQVRYQVLDHRYRRGISGDAKCLTMLAMNCPPFELPEAISSRMRDGRFVLHNHTGADVRPYMEGGA